MPLKYLKRSLSGNALTIAEIRHFQNCPGILGTGQAFSELHKHF
jgi:hypothetical protein